MQLRVGYDLIYNCPQATPMILMLNIHHTRAADIIVPDQMITTPFTSVTPYRDVFGNWCSRIIAPEGQIQLTATALLYDTGEPDFVPRTDYQHPVEELPNECLIYLLGSRYCETDRLSEVAWDLFGKVPPGAQRVQAICDYVHNHITFGYKHARSTKTAAEAFNERNGVCRDFAHLAITFCRSMNIPARYCTGYLGDIGVAPPYGPMDFAAWFEVYVGGQWCTFDARNNIPRIGRVLLARGRDATDVAISNSFGPSKLVSFKVWADELTSPQLDTGRASELANHLVYESESM